MFNKSTIVKRLEEAGVDPAFHDAIAQRAFYGAKNGEDTEDFIQEAILAHLDGRDIVSSVRSLSKQQRNQQSIEEMLEVNSGDHEFVIDLPEKITTDNDRSDWIPNDRIGRLMLIAQCLKHLAKDRTPVNDIASGGWRVHVMIRGRVMQFTGHKTPQLAVAELKRALKKIIDWCLPIDDKYFTRTCMKCGGSKSIGGVRFCKSCYRSGATKGNPS